MLTMNPEELPSGTTAVIESVVGNPTVATILNIILAIIVVAILLMLSRIIAHIAKKRVMYYAAGNDDKHVKQVAGLIRDMVFYSMVIFSFFV